MPIVEVRGLEVSFGSTSILRGLDFDLNEGQTLGVVGESGCGKSMTGLALMGMVPPPGRISNGSIKFDGQELVGLREAEYRKLRGRQLALVMQDPFTSLDPMMRIGHQISESLLIHTTMSKQQAWNRSLELLDEVGVPAPDTAAKKYPHQLSGGQRQRIVIAMAFATKPRVLIADEPTTALDVTLQAQILRLLRDLQAREGTAVMLISHDIGAIAAVSKKMAVYYAGKIVEIGTTEAVLRTPAMPYTQALLAAMPSATKDRLESISGQPPDLATLGPECAFAARCPKRFEPCVKEPSLSEVVSGQRVACWAAQSLAAKAEVN